MNPWQWFNAIALAVTATFALLIAVVAILYLPHLDAGPRMRAELPVVVALSLTWAAMALAAALAFVAQRRRWPARAWTEAALVLALGAGGFTLVEILR